MTTRGITFLFSVILLCTLCSCTYNSGSRKGHPSAQPVSDYYTLTPVPAYILEQFGSFGPREKSYPVPDNPIFAAPDGNPAEDGRTLEQPTSIENAFKTAESGDVIVLRGGEYRTGNLVFNKNITVQPYEDEQPVLRGTRIAEEWVSRGDYWVTKWDSMYYNDPPRWYKPGGRDGPACNYNNDLVIFDGRMFRPVQDSSLLEDGRFFCNYASNEILISEDPTGKSVEITYFQYGIRRIHDDEADADGPTILGLDLLGYARSCINIEGEDPNRILEPGEMPNSSANTHIENCRLLFSGDDGLRIYSPNSYVGYNDISMIANVAVGTRTSHNSVFEHNIVSNSNWFKLRIYPAGIKVFNQCYNYTVRNNYFADMPCEAVWYDVGHRDGVVVNNYFRNCGIGLKVEISHRTYVAGNVFEKANLWFCNSKNCMAYNNTMINSRIDLWRNNRGAGSWNRNYGWNHASTGPGPYNYHGHHVANNVFSGTEPRGGFYALFEDNNNYDTNFLADVWAQNLLLKEVEYLINAQFQPIALEPTKFSTLEEFRDIFGAYEEGNTELDISSDELFRSVSEGDYRLKRIKGLPEGTAMPDTLAGILGWKAKRPGLGAFAQ